jgi:hypothetical protein
LPHEEKEVTQTEVRVFGEDPEKPWHHDGSPRLTTEQYNSFLSPLRVPSLHP